MRTVLAFILLIATNAEAAPRRLTLPEAVREALRIEPIVAEAQLQDRRARVGELRAQLDRFSLKVDGSVQELWNKSNIGGPPIYGCSDPNTPVELCGQPLTTTSGTPSAASTPGTLTTMGVDQSPTQWLGLSNFQASLNYYLFSGFRVEANVARAKLQEKSALAQLRTTRKDTALQVARFYWNARRLQILSEVQSAALQRMVEAEAIAAARVRMGVAAPIDRNRATQRKLAQMATLEELRGQARAALAQLGVVLGTRDELELVDNPPIAERVPATPEELVRQALEQRPEIANARLQAAMQHELVRMARSGFYPQLTLFGLFQYGNNQLDVATGARGVGADAANPFAGLSGNFTAGVAATVNIFDTLNTYTATADAHYQQKVAEQETRRYQRLVDADVRVAHANLLKLYARREPLLRARDLAADNLRIVESRYKNGDALVIEYLDSEIELANAELQLADVTAQLQEQWLEVQASLGTIVGLDR